MRLEKWTGPFRFDIESPGIRVKKEKELEKGFVGGGTQLVSGIIALFGVSKVNFVV